MAARNGLLTLLVRLVSGRLRHEIGAYARREVRLVVVAVAGFVVCLTFILGAAAIAVTMLYAVLAPRLGQLESFGVLIGVALVVALLSLLIAMRAARAFTRWEGAQRRQPQSELSGVRHELRRRSLDGSRDDDASVALLISVVLRHLMSDWRGASR